MCRKVARMITSLLILICVQTLGVAATALPSISDYTFTLHPQKSKSSILDFFLFEKAEEENQKIEEGKEGMVMFVLQDFSRIAASLSFYHTPQVRFVTLTFPYDARLHPHQVNCVFLI